jgi:2'-hydroxyisoflavone reductase
VGGAGAVFARQPEGKPEKPVTPTKKLKILILGGTGFLGPAIIRAAQARGHSVTTFTRGRTRPTLFKDDEVEKLYGDRDPKKSAAIKNDDGTEKTYEGIKSLEGKKWDVVIDDSGYFPRIVRASAEVLGPNVGQYIFISSVSAYAMPLKANGDESDKLAELKDPAVETMGAQFENYGGLKVLCEQAVQEVCKGRATIVRPGFIVGPDDPTGRFTYWPVRVDKGGEVLAPGSPTDPIQLIDVRDLGEWLVHLAETNTLGEFDALGPRAGELNMGQVLAACGKATKTEHTLTWVPASFLEEQHFGLPIWVPPEGETEGFHKRNVTRAINAGLKFRPIEDTCKDTLEWWKSVPENERRKRLAAPPPEKEAEVLKAWAEHKAAQPRTPEEAKNNK